MNVSQTNVSQVEMSVTTVAIVIASQVMNLCLGFPLQCYAMHLLLSKPGGGGRSVDVNMIFAVSLTLVEILYCLVAPLYCVCIISLELCVGALLGLWLGTCMAGRYLFQCWLCLEQYVAVIHPMIFLKFKPMRYRVGLASSAWLIALGIGSASSCMFPAVPYNVFGAVYFVVFFLDSICCLSVLKALVRPGPSDKDNGEMNVAKKRAFKIISMNLVTFLVQVIPIVVSFGLLNTLPPESFHLGVAIGMFINIAGGFVHPIYVLHKYAKLP
ncbi:uracil nucleotide/cysteinyl leukotriene receptor-like [Silurus meridionalis]|nr:uracil nucleotide/cysteinyl leukotriene receptor-like [Silurus meridionalis]